MCTRGDAIGSLQRQVGELYGENKEQDRRITELETTMLGTDRNPGGFIGEMKTHVKEMRAVAEATRADMGKLATAIRPKKMSFSGFMKELAKIVGASAATAGALVAFLQVLK